jgi:hypothetical protein
MVFFFCLLLGAINALPFIIKIKNCILPQTQLFLAILRGTVISSYCFSIACPYAEINYEHKEKP